MGMGWTWQYKKGGAILDMRFECHGKGERISVFLHIDYSHFGPRSKYLFTFFSTAASWFTASSIWAFAIVSEIPLVLEWIWELFL